MLGSLFLVLPFCDWKWNIEWSAALSRELNATQVNLRTGTVRSNFTEFLTYSEYNSAACNLNLQ